MLRVLASNPLEAWTAAHFEEPIVTTGLSIGRVAVVNEPAAIRRVLMTNTANYQKDWLQRRVLSAALSNGLLTVETDQWKLQRIAMRQRRLAADPENAPRDILTLLLEARDPETGGALSDIEIRANILTFIAAGQETTANCITWTLYLLSQSRESRERVRAEADQEFDGSLEGLADRLPVTRAVIDETNRLYPPITAISRTAFGPDELAGEPIKPGTMIVIAPYVLHRHRALWVKPNHFDPSRFLGDERTRIDRFAYLPFGVGPRICIGATFAIQEASIIVAALMRHFTLEMASGCIPWPVQKVTLRPKDGLRMIVRRRR